MVLLVNLTLALGVGWGYLWWGRQVVRLQRELVAARAQGLAAEREWTVNGVVRAILPDLDVVVLTHEEIPGYMVPMTMGFRPRRRTFTREFASVTRYALPCAGCRRT